MNGEPIEILRSNIKRLMEAQGIPTQAELARIARVDPKTINNIFNDQWTGSPTLKSVDKIAVSLGVAVWQLYIPNLPIDAKANRAISGGMSERVYNLAAGLCVSSEETVQSVLALSAYSFDHDRSAKAKLFADLVRSEA